MADRILPQSWDDVDFDNFQGDNFSFVSGIQQATLERLTVTSLHKTIPQSIKELIRTYAYYTNGNFCMYDFVMDTSRLIDFMLGYNNPSDSCFLNPDSPISSSVSSYTIDDRIYNTCNLNYKFMDSNFLQYYFRADEADYKTAIAKTGYGHPISAFYDACMRLKNALNLMFLTPALGYSKVYSFEAQGDRAYTFEETVEYMREYWDESYAEEIANNPERQFDNTKDTVRRWSSSNYSPPIPYFIQSFTQAFTPVRLIAPYKMNPELHCCVVSYEMNRDINDIYTFDSPYTINNLNNINCGKSSGDKHILTEEHRIIPYTRLEAGRPYPTDSGDRITGAMYDIRCYAKYGTLGGFKFYDTGWE